MCLKLLLKQHRVMCRALRYTHKANFMWVVDNTKPVHGHIARLNMMNGGKDVGTYDFQTLYTKIPHADLKVKLGWVIEKAFEHAEKKVIGISQKGREAKFMVKPGEKTWTVTKEQLTVLVSALVDNIYVVCGDKIFRQTIGIPMGTDCAPYLANLYLYALEFAWVEKKVKEDSVAAKSVLARFRYCSRYIDDLCALNNGEAMETHKHDIYPAEMVLKKENTGNQHATFLDLDIDIVGNGRIGLALYDKRDDFAFDIVLHAHLPSNIPFRSAHGVIISQLKRFAECCTKSGDFFKRAAATTTRMIGQGFAKPVLEKYCGKFWLSYAELVRKYRNVNKQQFLGNCFAVAL
jgi:hypothetical protein